MKLFYCPRCADLVRVQKYSRHCECGESWGVYYSSADAVFGGKAVPLGISNDSLEKAVAEIPDGFNGEVNSFSAWVEGCKKKIGHFYAFAFGRQATGAMNVDQLAADRSAMIKALEKKKKRKVHAENDKRKPRHIWL
mgnify:CR=1 FL=1